MQIKLKNLESLQNFGVYCITNIINNKKYVGSTNVSFKKRYISHKNLLKNNKHHNIYLQQSVNKYGIENFVFEILEECDNKCEIRDKEKLFINNLQSLSFQQGYNLTNDTTHPPLTQEARKKIGDKLKEKYKTDPSFKERMLQQSFKRKNVPSWNKNLKCDNISNRRKEMFADIEIYDHNMNFFRRFDNAIEIEKFSRLPDNDLPILMDIPFIGRNFYTKENHKISYKKAKNKFILSQNIHRAIRTNSFYKGLFFKKVPRNSNISEKIG